MYVETLLFRLLTNACECFCRVLASGEPRQTSPLRAMDHAQDAQHTQPHNPNQRSQSVLLPVMPQRACLCNTPYILGLQQQQTYTLADFALLMQSWSMCRLATTCAHAYQELLCLDFPLPWLFWVRSGY